MTRQGRLVSVLLAVLGVHTCAPSAQYSAPLPLLLTEEVVNTMRMVVDSFASLEGRLPASLQEACTRVAPANYPPHCGYWLHTGDTLPLDGWRNPIRFEATESLTSIWSAGADRQFGSADDMGFNSQEERRRIAAAAGCYRVNLRDWKEFPGDMIRLDTTYHAGGAYRAFPEIEHYFIPLWEPSPYPSGRDSIYVIWQAIHHGVHFHFLVHQDSLSGFVFGGPYRRPRVVAHRVDCSP